MALEPDYGETLLYYEEADALTPEARQLLGHPIRKAQETNIGIAPEHIAVEMRNVLDDLRYQWEHQMGIDARTLGIATHAALVRIHPFVDGNGRATRLLADLVYLAGQTGLELIHAFNWEIDRTTNIGLLGEYVMTRKPNALAKIIPVINLEEAE